MIRFIKKIKGILLLNERIFSLETQINELDELFKQSISDHSKQFEKKIQDMTFAYTKNLDDTKSDYLKRYLEQRMNGMQYDIKQISLQIMPLSERIGLLEFDNEED